ncbi:hypothetical protein V6615_05695 [Oscillospiraceae bacterium PP1C4]
MTALQFGTFLFEHNPRKIELSFSNNVAGHILPARGTVSQNIGPRCRVVRCEGEVFASSADGAAAKLSAIGAVCTSKGEILYLPTGERFQAIVSRFGYSAQGDGRVISYTIEFIEQDSSGAGGNV